MTLAYVHVCVHTDAPQLRAVDVCAQSAAGLGRFLVRKRSFTIERIYAYKICAEKLNNHFILN
jgi:hypothetical protein